ncbi:hypothetical protein KRMM14A1259_60070 [Krasilnikovia sp. MM14-A1259]
MAVDVATALPGAGPAAPAAGARRVRELAGQQPVLFIVDNAEHVACPT